MKDLVVRDDAEAALGFADIESAGRLSALVDGALELQDAEQMIDRLLADPQLRAEWDAYHLLGDALRSEELATSTPVHAQTQASRFAQLLDAEPTVLAPRAPVVLAARRSNWLRYGLPGASAAAAVAMVSWIAFPQLSGSDSEQIAAAGKSQAVVSASGGYATPAVNPLQLQEYLSAHRQYSVGAMQSADFSAAQSNALPGAAIVNAAQEVSSPVTGPAPSDANPAPTAK